MNKSHTNESWAEYMREYRKRKPHIMKSIDLKKKYGISLEEYEIRLQEQDSVCAICGQPETRKDHRTKQIRSLAVDHNHSTGKIRGLLCTNCNTTLGLLNEDTNIMQNMINYIVKDGA
jgi:predicted transcriptional regulator YheO